MARPGHEEGRAVQIVRVPHRLQGRVLRCVQGLDVLDHGAESVGRLLDGEIAVHDDVRRGRDWITTAGESRALGIDPLG
eukprot:779154-Pyramimonas_sp.AAC.1